MRGLIWLTWRQHRWPILASAVLTALLAASMLVTTSRLQALAARCPAAGCEHGGDLDRTASFGSYQMNVVAFLPVLVAVFWDPGRGAEPEPGPSMCRKRSGWSPERLPRLGARQLPPPCHVIGRCSQ
jgi:hypothetical protein